MLNHLRTQLRMTEIPNFVIWSPLIGVSRSFVALGGLITVLLTPSNYLFRPVAGLGTYPLCTNIDQTGVFCLMRDNLPLAQGLCAIILISVISGFLPQVTSVLHAWVAFSISTSISIPEGGDQIATIIALFLIPICMTDPRINHWQVARSPRRFPEVRTGFAVTFLVGIKIQLTVLYFYSAAGKLFVTEWSEGTAVFYIGQGFFGASGAPLWLITELTSTPIGAAALTWGTILAELALAATLLTRGRTRAVVFVAGLCLHIGIIIFIGLWSFQIIMIGGLIILATPLRSTAFKDGFVLKGRLSQYACGFKEDVPAPHDVQAPAVVR